MSAAPERVLCVDLDGTLVTTDLLWESLLSAVRTRPWVLLVVPYWLLRGRSHLKRRLASASSLDFSTLPYRPETLSFVVNERRRGRRIVLATASDGALAQGVSRHLGVFDDVLASDGVTNLKGGTKARALAARFGSGKFDYVGDSRADIECWKIAAEAITVGAAPTEHVAHLRRLDPDTAVNTVGKLRSLRLLLRAVRPHQWLKNLLLAVPVVAAHQVDLASAGAVLVAFGSLSLCASGGYVLNDLLDLAADRRHPRKKGRPFASGQLSLATGVGLIIGLWLAGFALAAWLLPPMFLAAIAIYLAGTAAYSLHLKKEPVLDVVFLTGLYVLRVVAGGAATGVPISTWLLAFTLFVCLSLAFLKRFVEVRSIGDEGTDVPGRGYVADDANWLQSAGLASAYLSVVVLALYVNNPDVTALYSHPERLLLVCPLLLYWSTRTWVNAQHRRLHDDPLVAVAGDPATYVLLTLGVTIVGLAI